MAKKRAHGEGSIYKRPFTRADGTAYERWVSEADLGYQGGKRIRKTVYGKTRQEVKMKLDEIKRQLAQGTFVDSKLSVGDYLEAWLREVKGRVKPRTTELYTFIVNRYIKPRVGHVKLIKLAPLQVQEMVSGVAQDVGVRTANQCRTVLGIATRRALELQLLARNPVAAVKPLIRIPLNSLSPRKSLGDNPYRSIRVFVPIRYAQIDPFTQTNQSELVLERKSERLSCGHPTRLRSFLRWLAPTGCTRFSTWRWLPA